MQAFVARQAIFDRERRVYGYELLFRSSSRNDFDGADATSATTELLGNSVLVLGFNQLVGRKKAFINFGRDLLLSGFPAALPKDRTVVEILETVKPDPDVLAACENLRRQGYLLALDDFVENSGQEKFLPHSDIVKVEVNIAPPQKRRSLVRQFHGQGKKVVAEKVETHEQFAEARAAGYDYFQGFFFARPTIMTGQRIPAGKLACTRLLREISQPELDFDRLHNLIQHDVSLSYKLLKYVNSALFSLQVPVDSVRRALIFPGEERLRKWIAMAAWPYATAGKPPELLITSLVRAYMCESLARLSGRALPEQAFLTGMFSFLDALLDQPLDIALADLSLATPIQEALLGTAEGDNPLSLILELVRSYETGDWEAVLPPCEKIALDSDLLRNIYCEAVAWAEHSVTELV